MASENINVAKFQEILKRLMDDRGVTASVVCKATGIPKSTLSEWLSGRQPKLDEAVVRLARFFGVSVEKLILDCEPEEEFVQGMIEQMEDSFMTIHSGVYRFRVEKFVGQMKKKGQKGEE